MKIRSIDGAVASDGGTISCRVVFLRLRQRLLKCGLDARIGRTKEQRLIFVDAGYPTLPNARILPRDSAEEQEFIGALQEFVNREPTDEFCWRLLLNTVMDR